MAIPNSTKDMVSYFAGMIASDGPTRVDTALLKFTFSESTENYATPSRACTYNADGETVQPGGTGRFAGIIVGNQRVPSDSEESWYNNGDVIELMQMGEIAVNIDNVATETNGLTDVTPVLGDEVWFQQSTGKLCKVSTTKTGCTKIPGAIITKIGPVTYPMRAVISLTGPQPAAS